MAVCLVFLCIVQKCCVSQEACIREGEGMYRVLYRKYRPRFFADVIGQPQVTETLKSELRSGRLAHAYLFTGSRGTGKTTCSKILSKAVNCLDPKDGDPCGVCEICRGIDDGSVMDVVEIDAASNNGVDDIRSLREEANFTPANAKYRVYIIDEVHMLSIGAFNALLKTLEEPPEHVLFILATTEVHKIPATILSRCQRFDFHRISPRAIADRLCFVCESEGVSIDDNAALLIAGISDGAMRDALSLLDQCMGRSSGHITEETVRMTAGLADKSHLLSITEYIMNKDSTSFIEIINDLYKKSMDMARLCDELIDHFRELMLMKTMKQPRDIIVLSEDEYEKSLAQAMKISLGDVVRNIEILQESREKMLRGANRRIEMEMTAIKLCTGEGASAVSIDPALAGRVERLEKAVAGLSSGASVSVSGQTQVSRTILPSSQKPGGVDMDELRKNAVPMSRWAEVIEEVGKFSPTIAAGFAGSKAYISGNYLLVDSDKDICFEQLRRSDLRGKMKEIILAMTGQIYKLGRYTYPDEQKKDDPLSSFLKNLSESGVTVKEVDNGNG